MKKSFREEISMNKKYIVKNDYEKLFYFVLSDKEDIKEQLEKVFNITKGQGFTLEYSETQIKLIDYFHWETRAEFEIVSIEDTDEDVCYNKQNL